MMTTQKVTMTIKIEVLSVDSISNLLLALADAIEKERISGAIYYEDGDKITWVTNFTPVSF